MYDEFDLGLHFLPEKSGIRKVKPNSLDLLRKLPKTTEEVKLLVN